MYTQRLLHTFLFPVFFLEYHESANTDGPRVVKRHEGMKIVKVTWSLFSSFVRKK